jgi:hypothetical protein
VRRRLARSALALAALALACATPPWGTRPVTEEEQRAYDAAMTQAESDPAAARTALEAFIATWPDGPLVDDAEFALGEIARRGGDPETALLHYYRVTTGHPGGDRADEARVRIAEIERDRGNPDAARKILGRVKLSRLSEKDARRAYRVLADVAPDPVARLRWLSVLRAEVPETEVDAIDVEIDAVLASLDERSRHRPRRPRARRQAAAVTAPRPASRRGERAAAHARGGSDRRLAAAHLCRGHAPPASRDPKCFRDAGGGAAPHRTLRALRRGEPARHPARRRRLRRVRRRRGAPRAGDRA